MGVAANGSCGDLGGAPPGKVTPAYPILHPATCSWARAQHVHRGSSHAGSLCCEAGRLLREAARCGPVSARSGAAMQLAGPCAGSRAAAGHLPASLFTGSKPPTRVPNQSATLGPSSAPHSRRAARACLHSKRGAAQSDRSRQCAVRHHQLGRAPPARARRDARHPRTRNGARQTHHQRSPVSAGSCWPAWRAHGGNPSPQARLCRPVDAQGQVLVASTEHGGRSKWFLRGPGGRAPQESYTRLPHVAPRHLLLGKSSARPPRLQPRWQPVLRGREAAAGGCTVWAGQCPFGGCDAARRPLRGQPGCSWAPPSQPVHRVEASYTSAEPVCSAWALQHAPQIAESPQLVVNPSEAPLRSDRRGRCAVRHHQLGRALPARAWRDIRHPRTRNGARQTHHQRSPVSAGSCWPAWRAHGGNPSPQARLCRPVDAQGQVLVASTEHGGRSKWFLRGPGGRAPQESYTPLPHFAPRHLLLGKSAARPPRLQPRWQPVLRGREAAAGGCTVWAGQCPFGGCDAARRPLRGQPGCSWAPPSQPFHRIEASYTSAEPVCSAWALQHAPQAAESPELVFNPSEVPLRSDRRGRCAVRHHQLGRALPAQARRDARHPRTRNGARQTHHQRSPVSAGSCWPAWRAHGGISSPQARLCRPVDA